MDWTPRVCKSQRTKASHDDDEDREKQKQIPGDKLIPLSRRPPVIPSQAAVSLPSINECSG